MSSLPTTLPSSVELLQLLQEEAALQLLMSVRSSVFLVSCCTVRGRSTCFSVFTRPPREQYRYNRSCAIERTCWRVVTLRTNNFLPSADTSCWVLSSLSIIHASTLYPEEGTRSISTSSLTRLSPMLLATTFDLVLLVAHAEEVKLWHGFREDGRESWLLSRPYDSFMVTEKMSLGIRSVPVITTCNRLSLDHLLFA